MDAIVVWNLKEAWPGAARGEWYRESYGRYCELMGRWAAGRSRTTMALDGSRKVRAVEIELALFRQRNDR